MAGARKSYVQYIIRRIAPGTGMAFGFNDAQGKLGYDLTPAHHLSLSVMEGLSDLDSSSAIGNLGVNSLMLSKYHLTLANLGWRYAPEDHLMVTNRLAYMREKFSNRNRDRMDLAAGYYSEWVWQADATWIWRQSNTFDAGWSVRRIRDSGFSNRYQLNPFAVQSLEDASGSALRLGGYAEQSFNLTDDKVQVVAGVRWDRHDVNGVQALSPHAAITLAARPGTQLRFGWGQYVQYPELQLLLAKAGSRSLLPERSTHFLFSVEQSLGERTRLRAEFYEREDRDLTARPFYEPRLINGVIFNRLLSAPIRNSVRGYSRGFEVFLQKRTANRLSGWVSYSYGHTRLRDGEARISYFADQDQRHTVNIFGGWRVRPTVNLSLKGIYGSGYPLPGFYRMQSGQYYLAESRNALRLDAYSRIDARINKAYVFDRWKLTLYGEVVNLLNRSNRYPSCDGYNAKTGQTWMTLDRMFPILPSVGVVLEFEGR
jgi:outer membrane receptor for ferrienterochelin and colicin